jgi:hypothetical protein
MKLTLTQVILTLAIASTVNSYRVDSTVKLVPRGNNEVSSEHRGGRPQYAEIDSKAYSKGPARAAPRNMARAARRDTVREDPRDMARADPRETMARAVRKVRARTVTKVALTSLAPDGKKEETRARSKQDPEEEAVKETKLSNTRRKSKKELNQSMHPLVKMMKRIPSRRISPTELPRTVSLFLKLPPCCS